jgi:uncharacterized protein involved in exopolysaccharide biosynthesis
MDIIQLIRLILKHLKVVIIVPVALVILVFMLTRDMPKSYQSKTVVYTGIGTGYTLESVSNSNFDFLKNKTAFDNLINIIESRKTSEEVALRLLAKTLYYKTPYPQYITKEHYLKFMGEFSDSLKKKLTGNSYEETFDKLYGYIHKNQENDIYKLLNHDHPYFSIKAISKIKVNRISNSDLIEISYESDDPAICQQTLEILNNVFVNHYKDLKRNETNDVLAYFEEQLKIAKKRLQAAEQKLLKFNEENHIINYYEETKHISKYKEDLTLLYQQELMASVAAKAAKEKAQQQLDERNKSLIKHSDIVAQRKQLVDIAGKIAILEANKDSLPEYQDKLQNLYFQQNRLKVRMKETVNDLNIIENTNTGLSQTEILTQWLDNTIKYEESKARLTIFQEKLKELEKTYDHYAPLGATIKRIEREISVTEKEYLSILKGLNDSKAMKKNIQMSTNLKVLDKPFYPIIPKPSKRKLLVMAAGLVGFIMVVFLLIVVEYFDTTIKTPDRLKELAGIPVLGVYPRLLKKTKGVDFEYIKMRTVDEITQKLRYFASFHQTKPIVILFFSTKRGDGKTKIADVLMQKLESYEYNVAFLNYTLKGREDESLGQENHFSYSFEEVLKRDFDFDNFCSFNNVGDTIDKENRDFIFIEIPPILHNPTPIRIFYKTHYALLITRSNRAWTNAETRTLDYLKKTLPTDLPFEAVVNGVEVDTLDDIIGEIPKKRSLIRRLVKQLIKFQFTAKNKL